MNLVWHHPDMLNVRKQLFCWLVLLQWIHFDRFLHPRLRALEIRALWLGTGHMPTAWLGIEGSGES